MSLLLSSVFQNDSRLAACAGAQDEQIGQGEVGSHVLAIQYALLSLTGGWISGEELDATWFGPTTATITLGYNAARRIFRPGFVGKPEPVVGRATLEALDSEMIRLGIL
jgi:hypothetical protein